MSIEHKLIPAGEQHVVANWQVRTVPDLDNLTVTFGDIGKQAWVQGVGHYTLANSDPITWEAASSTIDSFAYNAGTKVLTITDSTGAAYTATIDGQNAAEVAALIAAHTGAADPHGDRAFSIQRANHTGTQLTSTISDFTTAASAAAPVQSVLGRTGAVVAQTGDYTVAQVTGAQSVANLSTDVNLAGGAGTYPNSVAVKAYADGLITKVWKDQGNFDVTASAGVWPTSANTAGAVAIKAGNLWVVTNAATNGTTMTGGKIVSSGDTIRALVDNATNAGADWGVNEANLGYTPENQANKVQNLSTPSAVTFPSTDAVIAGLATREPTLPANVTSAKFLREDRTWQVVPTKAQVYTTGSNYAVGDTVNHLGSTWTCNTAITSAPATMLVTSWDLTGLGAVRGFSSAFDMTQTNYTDDGGGNSGRSFLFSGSTFTLRNSSNVNLKIGSKVVVNCFTGGGTVNIATEGGVIVIGGVTSGVQTITCVKIATDTWLTYS